MPGTKAGGIAASITNKKRHGNNFYQRIGAVGGRRGKSGGFAANHDLARIAGAKGGRSGRRNGPASDTFVRAQKIRAMRGLEWEPEDIATALGRAVSTIKNYMRRFNIQ